MSPPPLLSLVTRLEAATRESHESPVGADNRSGRTKVPGRAAIAADTDQAGGVRPQVADEDVLGEVVVVGPQLDARAAEDHEAAVGADVVIVAILIGDPPDAFRRARLHVADIEAQLVVTERVS